MKTKPKLRTYRPTVPKELEAIKRNLLELRTDLALQRALLRETVEPLRPTGKAAGASVRYLSEQEATSYHTASTKLNGPEDTIHFCEKHFSVLLDRAIQEEVHILTLNGQNRVIRSHQITIGLLNSAPMHPREIFRPAILDAARAIVLVHNHPSGNSQPSKEDLKVTEQMQAAGKLLGIPLLDHIILAKGGSKSIIDWQAHKSLIG